MPPIARRTGGHAAGGSTTTRSTQPARKSSGSYAQRRDEARQLLESARARISHSSTYSDDGMDLDGPSFINESAEELINPIRDMAERVGREVELFAEQLDAWNPRKKQSQAAQKAALSLVKSYRNVAEDTVQRLREQHGARHKSLLKEEWDERRRRAGAILRNENNDDGTNDESPASFSKHTVEDLLEWQEELHTWQLVQNIIECRYEDEIGSSPAEQAEQLASTTHDRFNADGQSWRDFIVGNDAARERLVVLKWLEQTAEETGEDLGIIEECLEAASGRGKSLFISDWMNTREKIKAEKRLRLWDTPILSELPEIKNTAGTQELVTQLDLDAAVRQGQRTLEEGDRHFESSFWIMSWEMFRRGMSMKKIQEWCSDGNQYARAASLGVHLPLDASLEVEIRYRWRWACRALSRNGGLTNHERAVYGVLGGDRTKTDPACKDWSDFLYVACNFQLLHEYHSYLVHAYPDSIPSMLQNEHTESTKQLLRGGSAHDLGTLINSLQLKKASRLDSSQPHKLIQASIIGNDLEGFALRQGISLGQQARETDVAAYLEVLQRHLEHLGSESQIDVTIIGNSNTLRILTHLLVIFEPFGLDRGTGDYLQAVENVICAYISFLRLAGKYTLIPLYASMLSQARGVDTLAHVLPEIVNPADRQDVLSLMESSCIDVVGVLRTQYTQAVEYSSIQRDDNFTGLALLNHEEEKPWPRARISQFEARKLDLQEEILLRSVEWFALTEKRWVLAFSALTDVAKRFLESGRISAALELFNRLPFAEVSMLLTPSLLGKSINIMDEHEGSDDEKPPPLRRSSRKPMFKAVRGSRSTTPRKDKVHRDTLQSHAKTYYELGQLAAALDSLWSWRAVEDEYLQAHSSGTDTQRARQKLREQIDDLESAMEPLLHDFLVEPGPADTAEQLHHIRILYLPEMILAYISALYFASHALAKEHLLVVMDLATQVADNEDLIGCFQETKRMTDLVDAFALASKAMLALNEEKGSIGVSSMKGRKGKAKDNAKKMALWEISG